jgi:hypothetical protein
MDVLQRYRVAFWAGFIGTLTIVALLFWYIVRVKS